MMIFLKIYCAFSLVTFLVVEIGMYEIQQRAKRRYADKIKSNMNKVKLKFIEKICVHIKMFIMCFVPIVNIGMFWAVLFNGVKVQEDALNKVDRVIKKNES